MSPIVPISAAKQRIFNHNIQNLPIFCYQLISEHFGKKTWFYCKRLQNDGALNFLHFLWTTLYFWRDSDCHSICLYFSVCCSFFVYLCVSFFSCVLYRCVQNNNKPHHHHIVGVWVFAMPISLCGLRLDDEAVRIGVCLRLGWLFVLRIYATSVDELGLSLLRL